MNFGMSAVVDAFQRKWYLNHTLGAIDGKQMPIMKPPYACSEFYKRSNSTIKIAILNVNCQFILLDKYGNREAGDVQI